MMVSIDLIALKDVWLGPSIRERKQSIQVRCVMYSLDLNICVRQVCSSLMMNPFLRLDCVLVLWATCICRR
jgi:hypothetical protein